MSKGHKLKLKSTVLMYTAKSGTINLRYCSEIISIEDAQKDIAFFFSLLDGRFTEEQIRETFQKHYQNDNEIQNKLNDYITTVKELGIVELTTGNDNCLSQYQNERYSRNFEFFNTIIPFGNSKYYIQRKIADSRVILLGCGGLGSHIMLELAALGIENLTLVDYDKIELSNLNRQILYKENDIGKMKVYTAKENLLFFNSKINISAIHKKLESADDIFELIKGHDLVICVADKPRNKIVRWLNDACCKSGIPFINGGLDIRQAIFYSVIPGISGCIECWKSGLNGSERQIIEEDNFTNKDYVAPAPALSALVAVATGVIISETIKILTKIQPAGLTNKLKSFSFDDLTINTTEVWTKKDNCPYCK